MQKKVQKVFLKKIFYNFLKGSIQKIVRLPFKVHNPLASLSPVFSRLHKPFHFDWQFQQETVTTQSFTVTPQQNQQVIQHNQDISQAQLFEHIKHIQQKNSSMYYVFETIDRLLTQQSQTMHYNITTGNYYVCRFSLKSTAFQIGDTILGVFDFSKTNVSCTKVQCDLVFEELVASYLAKGNDAIILAKDNQPQNGANNNAQTRHIKLDPKISQTSVAYFVEHTLNTIMTNFHMMIPPHSPAQFTTDLCL